MINIQIPWDALTESALMGVIEEYVTREGTEYGGQDVDLVTKCQQVLRQLQSGEAIITYDESLQTCSVVVAS